MKRCSGARRPAVSVSEEENRKRRGEGPSEPREKPRLHRESLSRGEKVLVLGICLTQ